MHAMAYIKFPRSTFIVIVENVAILALKEQRIWMRNPQCADVPSVTLDIEFRVSLFIAYFLNIGLSRRMWGSPVRCPLNQSRQ
jgi:hypothetical protein